MDTDTPLTPEAVRTAQIEAEMTAQGVSTHTPVVDDYFGFEESHITYLPGSGESYVEHKTLNEGARKRYLSSLNRDMKIQKATQDVVLNMNPAGERHALISAALSGWNLRRGGQPVPFDARSLAEFLDKANPRVIDVIEKAVRLANPWLMAEVSLDDLLKERDDLDELITKKQEEEAGKSPS